MTYRSAASLLGADTGADTVMAGSAIVGQSSDGGMITAMRGQPERRQA